MKKNAKPIIEVRGLTVRYGENTVLENVSFDIFEGEIFAIVGGSGCGKSTLMRQIIGIETPTEGSIYVCGEDLTKAKREKRKRIMSRFGVMFQSGGLLASMTVGENLALPLEAKTKAAPEEISYLIDANLNVVGLRGSEDLLPSQLSGGMKKRVAVARALALNPDILCFDEPGSGLDPVTAASLDKLIKELNKALGATVIVVTHDLASILEISDRVVMLDKKAKGAIAEGTAEELKNYADDEYVYKFFNRLPL